MVDSREFIRIWQTSSSVAEVAAKSGTKKNACRVRASRYRNHKGIKLKQFPTVEPLPPTDWDELAEFADALVRDESAVASPPA